MGLVLQAPGDALLALAGSTAAMPGAPPAATPQGDVFASLLASLSAPLVGGPEESEATAEMPTLVAADDESDADGDHSTDLFAALLAMPVPVTLVPPQPEVAPQPVTATRSESSGTAAIGPLEKGGGLPAGLAVEIAGAGAAATAPGTAETEAAAAPPTDASLPTEAPTAAGNAALATTNAPEAAGAPAPASAPLDPVRQEGAAESAPPGTETPEQTSVVRSVGNAETETETGAGGTNRKNDVSERPQPRASVQGVAHAAPNSPVAELRTAAEAAPAEATAPAQPTPSTQTPPQVEQVANTVIERVEAGGGEARIHLDPVDLGEVTIHVHTDGDSVRVEVRAERHEAMSLLRDHTQDLSSLLGGRGLNLSDVNVGLGRGNGNQAWGQESREQAPPAPGEFAALFGLDSGASIEIHQRLRAAYNPDGAHIYRV